MLKQIVGMAFYEIIIIYAICFGGEHFIPEHNMKWRFDRPYSSFVYPGRLNDWDGSPLYSRYEDDFGASRHMTMVFNIFVVMAIFNLPNVRIIDDSKNIFKGLFNNWVFVIIWIIIAGG